jgi:hypothetical protein
VVAATSPKGLAAQLQQYYAQHTLLAVRQMRSVLTATPTYRQAADAELEEYTEELAQVVGGTFGEDQGERFERIWRGSITHFSAYAEAVAANDPAARQEARAGLLGDADAYGAWFAGVSDGRTRASEAAEVMRTHVEQLMEHADAYAADDYDQAYQTERQATSTCSPPAPSWPGPISRPRRRRPWTRQWSSCGRPSRCCWASTCS